MLYKNVLNGLWATAGYVLMALAVLLILPWTGGAAIKLTTGGEMALL